MNNLNYYAEWWENARKQTGILTKPTYLKQLEKELAQLKANPNYQHLASELAQWKAKYEKVCKELKDNDEIIDKLAEENQAKDQTITDLQQQIQELENKYSEIKGLVEKRLAEQKQEYEKQLNNATHNQASLLKTNLFQRTEIKQLAEKLSQIEEKTSRLASNNQQLRTNLTSKIFLLSKKETELQAASENLAKSEQEKEQILATFLQEKQEEKDTEIAKRKKSTTKVRKEIELLETLQSKDKEIKELKEQLSRK
jgi:DNA repair exonuclease SbcCD ATPase subunit